MSRQHPAPHRHHIPAVPTLTIIAVPALAGYVWHPTAAVLAAYPGIGNRVCAGVLIALGLTLLVLAAAQFKEEVY